MQVNYGFVWILFCSPESICWNLLLTEGSFGNFTRLVRCPWVVALQSQGRIATLQKLISMSECSNKRLNLFSVSLQLLFVLVSFILYVFCYNTTTIDLHQRFKSKKLIPFSQFVSKLNLPFFIKLFSHMYFVILKKHSNKIRQPFFQHFYTVKMTYSKQNFQTFTLRPQLCPQQEQDMLPPIFHNQ